jgi:hypothetical protein
LYEKRLGISQRLKHYLCCQAVWIEPQARYFLGYLPSILSALLTPKVKSAKSFSGKVMAIIAQLALVYPLGQEWQDVNQGGWF